MLLDMCHEELKPFHVNQKVTQEAGWAEVGAKERTNQDNQEEIMQKSVIRDIFGGVLKTELIVEGSNKTSVSFEPFYVLNLEIPRNSIDIKACLHSYFNEKKIHDFM